MRFLTNRPRPRDLTFDSLGHPALERRGMSSSISYRSFLLQFCEPARAIAELGFVDTEHIENAQQQISSGDGLRRIGKMPPSTELASAATRKNVRDVVMLMLIGISHVRTVQND